MGAKVVSGIVDLADATDAPADTPESILQQARDDFKEAAAAEVENRKNALDDLKFARLSEQWPEQIKKQREIEGRPCITVPRLQQFIRQVVNDARFNRPQIKIHPIDSTGDVAVADILDGIIRSIEHVSKADTAYDTAIEYSVSMGFGYWRISVDYAHDDSFDMDIRIDRISNPFSVYGDPRATSSDGSDWNVAFIVEKLSRDEFKRKYKNAEPVDWDEAGYNKLDLEWATEDDITVVEYFRREEVSREVVQVGSLTGDTMVVDAEKYAAAQESFTQLGWQELQRRTTKSWKVTRRVLTGAEILETTEWAGKYLPIVPVYGDEVNVEGRRHFRSLIRDAKDAQRMLNVWRSASAELVANAPKAPFIGPKGSFETDQLKWASANNNNYAYIEYDPVGNAPPPQRQEFAGPPAGVLQEAANATDDIKSIIGIYDASLGDTGNETSGAMVLARQKQGDRGTFHFRDNLGRSISHTGTILIDLIQKIYNKPRIVRTVGQDLAQSLTPINMPDPTTNRIINDLTVGKYDVVVDSGASFLTRRQEAAAQMMELMKIAPQVAPIIGDMLVKNLDWPQANEIVSRLQQAQQAQQQAGSQQAQQKAQETAAEVQKAQAIEQIKAQSAQAIKQTEVQATIQIAERQQQLEIELAKQKSALDSQLALSQQQAQQAQVEAQARVEMQVSKMKMLMEHDFEWRKEQLRSETQIALAQISAASKSGAIGGPDPNAVNQAVMENDLAPNAQALGSIADGMSALDASPETTNPAL